MEAAIITIDFLMQIAINGLMAGGLLALVAVGLTVVFGVLDVVNFAHGEFLMIASFTTFLLFEKLNINPYFSIIIVVPVMYVVGLLFYRLIISPVLDAPQTNQILLTLGVSIIMQNLAVTLFTGDLQTISIPFQRAQLNLGDIVIMLPNAIALLVAMVVIIGLMVFLRRTDMGRAIQAVSQDRIAASSMGINVKRLFGIALAIGFSTLGVAGALIVPLYYVSPFLGVDYLLMSWIIVVLGGTGSVTGAIVGGLGVGLVRSVGGIMLPGSFADLLVFALFVIVLIVRPQGLLGDRL